MPPRASVIIPDLDCALAGRAVEAILEQQGTDDLEVLVVGSDRPGVVPNVDRVSLIAGDTPLSPAAARNLGVTRAGGALLLFTDADCIVAPDWSRRLIDALREVSVVGGAVTFALEGNTWAVADNIASFAELLPDRSRSDDPQRPLGSLNLGVRREAWTTVGPFDEGLPTSEDHDWHFRALAAGVGTRFEPTATVEHLQVRTTRRALVEHAEWYGRHFHDFRVRHPGVFASGPTWRSRRRLAATAPLKAIAATASIYRRHPSLRPAWRCFPAVVLFKLAWYRAVVHGWPGAS